MRSIAVTAVAVVLLILAGAGGLLLFAASRLDAVQAEREAALVERRMERMQAQLIEDVTSASVWNDAVPALQSLDFDWMQVNFGDYYADYMDHTVTLTFDGERALIDASRDSERVPLDSVSDFAGQVAPLVAEVAARAAEPDRRAAFALDAAATGSTLVRVDDALYLVAAATVVPEDAKTPRATRDAVIVSARPISAYLQSLIDDLAVVSPTLELQPRSGVGRMVLRGSKGEALGTVRWLPLRPGRDIIMQAVPWLAGILALLAGAAGILIWRVDRVARRLARSEAALVEARDRAEAANEAKSRFLSNVSHELRTPLNGVMGMAEVLSLGPLSPQQEAHLTILKSSGADLLVLIEHLLTVTRMERQEIIEPEIEAFDPNALLNELIQSHQERAAAKGLALTLTSSLTGARLGAARSLGDAVGYLLDNALTFTDVGSIKVTASGQGDRVMISVADTGIGIAPEILPRLFDRFVQGDDSATRRYEGVGLGLSICHGLIEAMGGRIGVESEPGHGACFTLSLPLPFAEENPALETLAA